MPPSRNPSRHIPSGPATGTATPRDESPPGESLVDARQEIERLTALLQATQDQLTQAQTPTPTPNPDITALVGTLVQALGRTGASPAPTKSPKVPDPPVLTNGKDPTFTSWKKLVIGKLTDNADHYRNEQARINYVFGRTGGDAQEHVQPRIGDGAIEPFQTAEEMLDHLSGIYEDPFRVDNARQSYRKLIMKANEQFTTFFTRFMHLAGQGQIPSSDLFDDLWDKVSLDLQQALIPMRRTVKTLPELKEACQGADNDLRRIKELRSRSRPSATPTSNLSGGPVTHQSLTVSTRFPSKERTQASTGQPSRLDPNRPRPVYDNPRTQDRSRRGECFRCGQFGHMVADCPVKNEVSEVQQTGDSLETDTESGKEQP